MELTDASFLILKLIRINRQLKEGEEGWTEEEELEKNSGGKLSHPSFVVSCLFFSPTKTDHLTAEGFTSSPSGLPPALYSIDEGFMARPGPTHSPEIINVLSSVASANRSGCISHLSNPAHLYI